MKKDTHKGWKFYLKNFKGKDGSVKLSDRKIAIELVAFLDRIPFYDSSVLRNHPKTRKKYKLREDLMYLRENKLSLLRAKTYTPETLALEEEKLENEINSLLVEEQISEQAMKETLKDVWTISELLKDIVITWDFADLYEKQEIVKTIFSELSISENTLKYKVNSGFIPFETRFVSGCAGERT